MTTRPTTTSDCTEMARQMDAIADLVRDLEFSIIAADEMDTREAAAQINRRIALLVDMAFGD